MSYKRLGDYINRLGVKNTKGKVSNLQGINIDKYFMPSVANVIGTDLTRYKIVKPNQFACNRMHVGRDKKLPIAISKFDSEIIVSPAYDVFEIVDTNQLNPDYLMMWFSREEFDRNCWFYTDTDVRGKLGWDSLCDMKLPIPNIEKQRAIVKEYQTVTHRIELNETLNQKLEETAQALYKHWFVDFEFPNQEGKPYKSSGGAMVYNEELDKEIPEGWEVRSLGGIVKFYDSKRIPLSKDERNKRKGIYPYYGAATLVDYIDDFIFDGTYILLGEDGSVINEDRSPVLQFVWGKFWVNNHAHVLRGKESFSTELIYLMLKESDVSSLITGGVQAKISKTNLSKLSLLVPNDKVMLKLFTSKIIDFFDLMKVYLSENKIFKELQKVLLSKMSKVE